MSDYSPPLEDIVFVLRNIAGVDDLAKLPAFSNVGLESLDDILFEAGRFATAVVAPTNRVGDVEGSRRNADGTVSTPEGFAKAYQSYVEAGWPAVAFGAEHGGGGLPWVVGCAVQEMMTAANMAWSLCPMLTHGSIHLLAAHGNEIQQETWLRRLVSGEWTGTMNLTESQAGSDVGAVTTKAIPQGDGTYRITGQKIFITWGEHDMADNIVHLTLARVPDAAPGTRGISCFIVPKMLLVDGKPEQHNSVQCLSLEHKMGIHGSPTCVLSFDDAVGYLVGEPNAGMTYMFTMMNNARLSVGLEGLGIADRAYQQALAFARERRQGRAANTPKSQTALIIEHPDVRRMLMTMRALTEASRCLCYLTAASTDLARHDPDDERARGAQERADLLTPLAKAWSTDLGSEVASLGVQVHGGYGYIEETGAAQHLRDIRIASIYEGTNGIQAIDLVTRKLGMRRGGAMYELLDEIDATVAQLAQHGWGDAACQLADASRQVRSATEWIVATREQPVDVLAGATPYLQATALTVGGWLLARSVLSLAGVTSDFATRKRATTSFYLAQLLPRVSGLSPAITAGAAALDLG